jgi:hypothetical protein
MKKTHLLIFFFLYLHLVQAQEQKPYLFVDAKILSGTILPHYSFMNYLVEERQKSFEIQVRKQTNTQCISSFLYRYPTYGIAYNFTSLGNRQKIGYASSLFAVLDIPIVTHKQFSLLYQCNLGLAYIHSPVSKRIHNIAMSNHLNYFIGIDLFSQYRLSQSSAIRFGIDVSHISNGKVRTPNLGYNSIALSSSYTHTLAYNKYEYALYNYKNLPTHHAIHAIWSGGLKADDYLGEKRFPTSSLIVEYQPIFFYKYGVVLGADLFYDASKPEHLFERNAQINAGLHTGVEVYYLPFGFTMQTGMYVYNIPKDQRHFMRVALRYYTEKSYIFQLGLKTHNATADFLEIGVGYRIPNIRTLGNEIHAY